MHGHTPTWSRRPEERPNLDTGAGYEGPLTAAVFEPGRAQPVAFLTGTDEVIVP